MTPIVSPTIIRNTNTREKAVVRPYKPENVHLQTWVFTPSGEIRLASDDNEEIPYCIKATFRKISLDVCDGLSDTQNFKLENGMIVKNNKVISTDPTQEEYIGVDPTQKYAGLCLYAMGSLVSSSIWGVEVLESSLLPFPDLPVLLPPTVSPSRQSSNVSSSSPSSNNLFQV